MKRIPDDVKAWAAGLLLAALTAVPYLQTGGFSFVNYDDGRYVYENPHVSRGFTKEGIAWALRSFDADNWHPLTWLSHMADVELFGRDAGRHHLMNLLFHLLNTALLFAVLHRMTHDLGRSAFVAGLFGVHPLHVESVAWIAERKDLLCAFFWILTMGAYLRYVRNPGPWRYGQVAAGLSLGLSCKPMAVTLPFALLLLDWWPLARLGPGPVSRSEIFRLIREKIPLMALSAGSCVLTLLAQAKGGALKSMEAFPAAARISNAVVSCADYLAKTVWPSSLAVFYPHPSSVGADIPGWRIGGAILLLAGISCLVLLQARRRPYLAVGWLLYLGTLVPVAGLVQVGSQAMADRYTYIPLTGIFIAVAWGIPSALGERGRKERALAAAALAALLALAAAARVQAGYWRDSFTLFERAKRVTEKNWLASNNLGAAREKSGRYEEAIADFREALTYRPDYAEAWYNLGVAYEKSGRPEEAVGHYLTALAKNPNYPDAWYNLGVVREKLGLPRQAAAAYEEAVRIDRDHAEAWYNLGVLLGNLGRQERAVSCFREAVRVRPDRAEAWNNMGIAYAGLNRHRQSIESFREAVRVKPDHANAWYNMGVAHVLLGEREAALVIARRLRPIDSAKSDSLLSALGSAK
jgi:tetratricopeptide (TPR) repeat protein